MNYLEQVTQHEYPIAFSQVREDPRLDLQALQNCGSHARVLMIASGGDSLAYLACQKSIQSLNVLDANPAQILLSRLKIKLLELEPAERLQLLGHHQLAPEIRLHKISRLCQSMNIDIKALGSQTTLATEGLDYLGRFERLFHAMQNELSITIKNKLHSKQAFSLDPNNHAELQTLFQKYFSLPILTSLFGPEATQNPLQNFDTHFLQQTLSFLQKPEAYQSPFIQQFLCGKFLNHSYAWHSLQAQKNSAPIHYHNEIMYDFLKISDDASFDFIHLSNILDWLSPIQASELLAEVNRCLSPQGKVFIRQLNSSLNIRDCAPFLNWHIKASEFFLQQDQSFFYRQIHFGSKS